MFGFNKSLMFCIKKADLTPEFMENDGLYFIFKHTRIYTVHRDFQSYQRFNFVTFLEQ